MLDQEREKLRAIKTFPSLVKYLRDELDWPIETEDFNEIVFDYEAEELGIDPETAVKIDEIKQLRPLVTNQPWGIFFIKFEPKRLPVVVLRRILSRLVFKKRASANKSEHASWNLDDLLFISNYGEDEQRQITFAHFSQDKATGDLPTLKVLGWDDADTALHLDYCHQELKGKLHWPADEHNLKDWCEKWSSAFILRHREVITTSKDLASRLADLAKRIRSRANRVLAIETERGQLRKLYKSFQEALIHDLSEDDFADMYAQTIAYGLLAARVSRPMGVTADNVADLIPITNPFLRDMLGTFLTAGGRKGAIDFDELGVQEVVELLNSPDTHMDAILRDFGNRTQQEDPVIHFYEDFLSEYDKKKKVQRGVFFTPQQVVSYIVRIVHELLQSEFGLEDGLADITTWGEMVKRKPDIKIPEGISPDEPFVQILDPATGTATFLVEVIDLVYKTMRAKWIKQGHMALETQTLWNKYIPKHLLPRLYGFELMMAPYAIAHMKLGLKLYETGYTFNSDERVHVYLTNSLEPAIDSIPQRVFEQWASALAYEAQAVNTIKSGRRFTVIIGNPPYSVSSANKGKYIDQLMESYKTAVKDEQNIQPLSDDYVKFICFCQHLIQRAGYGIFGMITNNSYLSGLIHRGMRYEIIKDFSQIYAINLHGNSMLGETAPNGNPDKNVFDIRQGVAISLFVRVPQEPRMGRVKYLDLWGERLTKYDWLLKNNVATDNGQEVQPTSPNFFFIAKDFELAVEYQSWWKLSDVFQVNTSGIKTHRDHLVIDFDEATLRDRITAFRTAAPDSDVRKHFELSDTGSWKPSKARETLQKDRDWQRAFIKYLYRPFDIQYIFYHDAMIDRARRDVMSHMLRKNIAILAMRQVAAAGDYTHFGVTRTIVDNRVFYSNRGIPNIFPLYIYPLSNMDRNMIFSSQVFDREPNISSKFTSAIAVNLHRRFIPDGAGDLNDTFGPEDILNYAYAIFHSPSYRRRYAELLIIDFPHLPLTSSLELFDLLSQLGGELVALHLMESPRLNTPITKWDGITPSNEVEKVTYSDKTVWIDKGQTEGFRDVPENVWNFHIGGYQVCEKWLKDRKGRVLSAEDITHYQKIVVALNETIRLMKEIDEVIEEHGGWPGAFIDSEE